MSLLMKVSLFCCLGMFEVICHPLASGKWRAGDSLALRRYYSVRRSADNSNKILPPMMYFGSRKELPPTLYAGDELKESERYPSPGFIRAVNSLRDAPPKIHSGWRAGDEINDGPQKPIPHAGWRAGDITEDIPPRLHSGYRSGDSISEEMYQK